jgi:hypothetical protein
MVQSPGRRAEDGGSLDTILFLFMAAWPMEFQRGSLANVDSIGDLADERGNPQPCHDVMAVHFAWFSTIQIVYDAFL